MFEPREPAETIKFVDDYCEWYRNLFPEVRSFEAFKYLHIGMISDIKRKTLPAISRVVGLSEQGLLHFLTNHLGRVSIESKIKADFTSISRPRNPLIIDETGDRKRRHNRLC